MTHTFEIPGEPTGKGRPRFSGGKSGRVHTYTPEKTAKYEQLVRRCWRESGGESYGDRQVRVSICAYFPIPKSYPKKRVEAICMFGEQPVKKPDCDNIIKVILDALNGLAYDDDRQVVAVCCIKRYAVRGREPGVVVEISEAAGGTNESEQ